MSGIAARLRVWCNETRRGPTPLKYAIPLAQQAADALDESERQLREWQDACGAAQEELRKCQQDAIALQDKVDELRQALAEEMSDEINVRLMRARLLLVKGCGYIDPIPDGRAEYVDTVREFLAATAPTTSDKSTEAMTYGDLLHGGEPYERAVDMQLKYGLCQKCGAVHHLRGGCSPPDKSKGAE